MSNRIAIDIHERSAFAGGHEFDEASAYERLTGRARFAVDPDAPAQAGIVDLDKASRNDDGLVEFTTDLCILQPADPARGNRRLFFDYGNRGNKRAVQYFCDAPACNDPVDAGARRQRLPVPPRLHGGVGRLAGRPAAGRRPHDPDPARRDRRRGAAHRPGADRVHRRAGGPDHAAAERLGLHPQPPDGLARPVESAADTAPLPR